MSEQKRIAAYVSLVKALEGEKTHLSALAEAGRVAVATLQSERDANATLTADVARLSAALTEALAQLEAERARNALDAADAARWRRWLPWMRRVSRVPFDLANEIRRIDDAAEPPLAIIPGEASK